MNKFPASIVVPYGVTLETRNELVSLIATATFFASQRKSDPEIWKLEMPPILGDNDIPVPFTGAKWPIASVNEETALRYLNGSDDDPGYLSYVNRTISSYNEDLEVGRILEASNITALASEFAQVGWAYLCQLQSYTDAKAGKVMSSTPTLPADLIQDYKKVQ